MPKILLFLLTFSFLACEDNLNKTTDNVRVVDRPTVCPEPEEGGVEPSPLKFNGIDAVTNVSMTSARVSWEHVDGFYQYHVISIQKSGNKILKTIKAPKKRVTLNGLTPDTTYEFMIRGIDESGMIENNSKKITITTLPWPNFNNMKSLSLDGNTFAQLGPSSEFNTKGAKSISMWFNGKSFNKAVFIDRLFTFFNEDKAKSGLSVGVETDKLTLIYTNKRKELKTQSAATNLKTETWNHLIVSYNNTFIILYLNGTQVLKIQDSLDDFGALNAKIGSFTERHSFEGLIDEFAYYDVALNSSHVKKLYNSGRTQDLQLAVRNKRLIHWYRMGDDSADSATHLQDLVGDQHATPSTGDVFNFGEGAP